MTVEEALEYADEWTRGLTVRADSLGWRVVCAILAQEVRRRHGIGGELIAARRERDEAEGMAGCMDMLRRDLIAAKIIPESVPPMMMTEAVMLIVAERDGLAAAARQTLDENGHLADGDNCTLKVLKDALAERPKFMKEGSK